MMRWSVITTVLLCGLACDEPEGPPQQYVPGDRGGDHGGDTDRRAPGERPGGEVSAPGEALPPHWACNPLFYNTRDGCDCGCGIPDPDCGALGCAVPGCDADGCEYCHTDSGIQYRCGTTPPPAEWTCNGFFFGDGECDCGCGAADPDCGADGCVPPGCTATGCAFCWDGGEDPIDCE